MLASLTTLIAGIARLPLRADQLGGLEAPQPGQGGAAAQERGVDREGAGPTEAAPRRLLEKVAAGLA